jgi:hypothetical protein
MERRKDEVIDLKREPTLCNFDRIELRIPSNQRVKLIKLAYKPTFLKEEELVFCKVWQAKAEIVINNALHLKSIAEKALLRAK